MKKSIIFLAMILIAVPMFAQPEQTYTEAFDSVFINVSYTDATTGILYERSIPFAMLYNFNSSIAPVDTSNSRRFIRGFSELYDAAFQPSARLPFNVDSLQSLIGNSGNVVDIGILHYKFNSFDTLVAYQKLYLDTDSIPHEHTSITASLYTELTAFMASPLAETTMSTTTYRFRDILRFNNTGNSIVAL